MKFILIHGAYGNSEKNWYPWLKQELKKLCPGVYVPDFPTPENQTLENWMKIIEKFEIDEDTVLIGHSLGVAFILNIVEKTKVKAVFLVSGWTGKLNNPKFDDINKTFAEKDFDFGKIKNNAGEISIYHSDNDPYVSLEKAEQLDEILGSKFKIIKNAGHFNKDAGYTKFPELLEDIKNI